MPDKQVIMDVRHLTKWVPIKRGLALKTVGNVKAVDDVSFQVYEGEMCIRDREQLGKKCWASLFGAYVRGLYPASRVVNRSCSGLDSTQLRENIRQFAEDKDRLVLLMIGSNDRRLEDGQKRLKENVKYLLDYFNRKNKSVLLMSYPPPAEAHESRSDLFFQMAEVDRILGEAAASRYVPFLSHYKLLLLSLIHI